MNDATIRYETSLTVMKNFRTRSEALFNSFCQSTSVSLSFQEMPIMVISMLRSAFQRKMEMSGSLFLKTMLFHRSIFHALREYWKQQMNGAKNIPRKKLMISDTDSPENRLTNTGITREEDGDFGNSQLCSCYVYRIQDNGKRYIRISEYPIPQKIMKTKL